MAPVTVTVPIPSTYLPPISDPAMKAFNWGVKCDPNNFQTFSNKKHLSDCKDHDIATSNSQYVENVLDPNLVDINGVAMDFDIIYIFIPQGIDIYGQ